MKYYFKENFRLMYADGQLYGPHDEVVYKYENMTLFLPQVNLYKYGKKVGHIKKNFTLFLRSYDIFIDDVFVDSLDQELTFFHPELSLRKLGWTVKGDFFAWDYEIINERGRVIADVNQEIFHLTKHYCIDIHDESNEELIVLVILAINQFDKDRDSSASLGAHSSNNRH